MKTILVSNRKGGVGKTTTSINLSIAFTKLDKRVLLMDMDTQGHIYYGLGCSRNFLKGVHRSMVDGDLDGAIYETGIKNLSILPADENFDISRVDNNNETLKSIVEKSDIQNRFDICVIDTSPSLDILLFNALYLSDYVIIPMQVEYLSFIGAVQFLKILYKTASSMSSQIKLLGVVPTMFNKSMKEHLEIVAELKKIIGKSRVFEPIRKDAKISKAFSEGKPIALYDDRSRGAKDYDILAQEALKQIYQKTNLP